MLIIWIAAVKNPTNIDSAVESSATSVAEQSLALSNGGFGDSITPDWYAESIAKHLISVAFQTQSCLRGGIGSEPPS